MLMEEKEFGGFGEMAALLEETLFLDVAKLFEGFFELAGEARAVQAEFGQQWNQDFGVGILDEQVGFEELDAFETPGGIGHFVDQLSLGGGGGFVLVEKLLDVKVVSCGVLCWQDCGAGGEAMGQCVQ